MECLAVVASAVVVATVVAGDAGHDGVACTSDHAVRAGARAHSVETPSLIEAKACFHLGRRQRSAHCHVQMSHVFQALVSLESPWGVVAAVASSVVVVAVHEAPTTGKIGLLLCEET